MTTYKERKARQKADEAKARRSESKRAPVRPKHVCSPDCEHYVSPLEQQISDAIAEVLKKFEPPGAKAVTGWDAHQYCSPTRIKLVCSGATPIMALSCCMKPNHPGRCFSALKMVEFTPEIR